MENLALASYGKFNNEHFEKIWSLMTLRPLPDGLLVEQNPNWLCRKGLLVIYLQRAKTKMKILASAINGKCNKEHFGIRMSKIR